MLIISNYYFIFISFYLNGKFIYISFNFFIIFITFILVNCIQWNYKYSLTGQQQQQLSIKCLNNDQIWIGWSHYGTRLATTVVDTHLYKQTEFSSLHQQSNDFPTINMYVYNFLRCFLLKLRP